MSATSTTSVVRQLDVAFANRPRGQFEEIALRLMTNPDIVGQVEAWALGCIGGMDSEQYKTIELLLEHRDVVELYERFDQDEDDPEDDLCDDGCGQPANCCTCAELESLRAHNANPDTRGSVWTP